MQSNNSRALPYLRDITHTRRQPPRLQPRHPLRQRFDHAKQNAILAADRRASNSVRDYRQRFSPSPVFWSEQTRPIAQRQASQLALCWI